MTHGRYFGETRKSDSRSSGRRRCDGCYRADPPGRWETVSAGRSISQAGPPPWREWCPSQKHQDPSVWFAHRCVWAIYQPGGIRRDIEAPAPSCWEGTYRGPLHFGPVRDIWDGHQPMSWQSPQPAGGYIVDRRPSGSLALDGMPSCLRSDRSKFQNPPCRQNNPREGGGSWG